MARLRGRAAQRFRDMVIAEYGDTCHLCGLPGATTADHLIPVSLGGPNTLANARPAHRWCNSARGAAQLTADPTTEEGIDFFRTPAAPGKPGAAETFPPDPYQKTA